MKRRRQKRQSNDSNAPPHPQTRESEELELPKDIKDVLELVPEEKRTKALEKLTLISVKSTESHIGPIPHPQILEGYDRLIPGAAEKIMQQAEQQARHRQNLEKLLAEEGVKQEKRGQWFGFILGALSMGAGTFLTYRGMMQWEVLYSRPL